MREYKFTRLMIDGGKTTHCHNARCDRAARDHAKEQFRNDPNIAELRVSRVGSGTVFYASRLTEDL